MSTELPYLAHGPIGRPLPSSRRTSVISTTVGSPLRVSSPVGPLGTKGTLLLKAAISATIARICTSKVPEGHTRACLCCWTAVSVKVFWRRQSRTCPSGNSPKQFDQDPFLLGVPGNGVVDLRTGQLRDMQRTDYITKRTRVRPDPNCEPKRFLKFMDEITDGDTELNAYPDAPRRLRFDRLHNGSIVCPFGGDREATAKASC